MRTLSLHRSRVAAALAAALCSAACTVPRPAAGQTAMIMPAPIRGFPADALAGQVAREKQARAVPNADTLKNQLRILSENPHEAGTERSHHVAELILARFRSFGLDAQIEQFEALMPRPTERVLEQVGGAHFVASLKERVLPEDKDSGDPDQLPTAHFYSPDGDVTAPLVFVNYGLPEDYRVLDSLHISVQGKIVIAKYGRSWRGIKPKLAAEHGAIGCIVYSDPKDDGFFVDDVYPKGPMRPGFGVQRGSVMDMPTYPGDPLSPGWASVPGDPHRLTLAEAKTIEPIPSIPISYDDALPFFKDLGGPVAPEAWRGAMPTTYHVGPGATPVHFKLKYEWKTRPLYDVIARIPGAQSPDQWVIYGNHHDAWVNGASDPLSGQVALDETARALGTLLKSGWRPARTIILAAWDGEEWGLLGSTEWGERHADEIRRNAVAYINSDVNGRGPLGVEGSHALQTFVTQLARDIPYPNSTKSAWEVMMERRARPRARQGLRPDTSALEREAERVRGESTGDRPDRRDTSWVMAALGSGSDYTVYIDHLVVPTLSISYGGDTHDGQYHSIYDSYDLVTRFLDTSFAWGVAEAQTNATALLRLSDAPVVPLEFGNAARAYRRYADEIAAEAKKNDTVKTLDLSAVQKAIDGLEQASGRYETALAKLDAMKSSDLKKRWKQLAPVNRMIYQTEQALADTVGLPQRDWFRNTIYAPGYYTGYGVKTMPGIREAVEDRPNVSVAQAQTARVAAAINRLSESVNAAAIALEGALK
jgi:N-acetylated-alpha-linked acidic dipeptidase